MWLHRLHLCLITATDGSVTGFSLLLLLRSHSFPPFSYCQHTFTSNSMACTRLFLLLITLHAIHMISAAPFLVSFLPLQTQRKWGLSTVRWSNDFVLNWPMCPIYQEVLREAFHFNRTVFSLSILDWVLLITAFTLILSVWFIWILAVINNYCHNHLIWWLLSQSVYQPTKYEKCLLQFPKA